MKVAVTTNNYARQLSTPYQFLKANEEVRFADNFSSLIVNVQIAILYTFRNFDREEISYSNRVLRISIDSVRDQSALIVLG